MSVFRPAVYATVRKGFLPDSFSNCWQPNALSRNEDFHFVLRNNEEFAAPFAQISFIERLPFIRSQKLGSNLTMKT
jgi:hypothetical protein